MLRHSTGIYRMDTHCKHAVKISGYTSLSASQKFSVPMDYGLQNFPNVSRRPFWQTTRTTAHRRLESRLELDQLLMNPRGCFPSSQRQLYILIAFIHVVKAAPNGLGLGISSNILQVRTWNILKNFLLPNSKTLFRISMTFRFRIVLSPSIHSSSLQPHNQFLTRRLERCTRRKGFTLSTVHQGCSISRLRHLHLCVSARLD